MSNSIGFDPRNHLFKSPIVQAIVAAAIDFFINSPAIDFPPSTIFQGSGVYALYFTGKEGIYAPLGRRNELKLDIPIYVGKADTRGGRRGKIEEGEGTQVYNRLREHYRSIKAADNLSFSDFKCRFILMMGEEAGLIRTVESALIARYLPLWNSYIDGFGIHDPGSGRDKQLWSEWDSIHPGRGFTQKLQSPIRPNEPILEKIRIALENLD